MTAGPALQRVLAGEHAAIYVYGVIGGRLSFASHAALANRVSAAYTTHRARRDRLEAMIRAAGRTPVAAEVSYQLPNPCRTTAQLTAAARVVEDRCAAGYADLVAATTGGQRAWAVGALTDAAVRELGVGGTPTAYPGAPDLRTNRPPAIG
ncbi:MAG: ferritin-like domain-containing protein [Nocardioidaceae bacterium]